jgi:hypothetical protein
MVLDDALNLILRDSNSSAAAAPAPTAAAAAQQSATNNTRSILIIARGAKAAFVCAFSIAFTRINARERRHWSCQ